ncbi:hypothetical protein FGM00_15725 [Aggregatimonas sangjinii]|uniref:Uncharacterized protein n=1 Tax=Aggregatimonas sangjinii TaxID=2583587 RepID=A0A5B7SXI3_9FLAO|nr:hypothetical protein [Aggregatimonas sangjinii]QCX01484.1 hypothetical protein FGM00_15725 [Aggregatimonas sangjinii]
MKSILLCFGLLFISFLSPDISAVRADYRSASENQEEAEKLYTELASVSDTDEVLLLGYKGATATLMAKYAKGVSAKTAYFKEGKGLIEQAISTAPDNIELRYIRLSVQENAPKIVRYHKEIDEDKQFILDHYPNLKDGETKKYIKGFVSQSASFSEAEKQLF